jgi:hypothetical protein
VIGRLNLVVLCLVGVTVAAITGCGKRQPPSQVTPPRVEPPQEQVKAGPAGPIEVPEYPEPADNGFEELAAAAEELRGAEGDIHDAHKLAWDQDNPLADKVLADSAATLARARDALARPCLLPRPQRQDEKFRYLSGFRRLAQLLVLEGRSHERHGHHHDACDSYLAALELASVTVKNGVFVHVLNGFAAVATAAPDLARCIGSGQLSGEALQHVNAALTEAWQDRARLVEAVAIEWAWTDGWFTSKELADNWPAADIERARKEYRAIMSEAVQRLAKPYWELKGDPPLPEPQTELNQLAVPVWARCGAKEAERDTWLCGLRILAAIELFREQRGASPTSLSELTPDYLSEIPMDPFTGKPFTYRLTDGSYVLYSVGPDAKDDGGAPLDRGTNEGDIVIWPVEGRAEPFR